MAKFRVVVVLLGVVALWMFAFAIASLIANGGASRSWGWTAAPEKSGWHVTAVDEDGPAAGLLLPGDRILDLQGVLLKPGDHTAIFRSAIPIGGRYSVTVLRNERVLKHGLTVQKGQRNLGRRLVYVFVSLVWCVVGLFIGYAKPHDAVARLACLAAVATGVVYVDVGVMPGVVPAELYQPLHMVLGYHFFYRFPGGVRRGRVARAGLWVFYGWWAITCAVRQPINWLLLTEGAGAAAMWAARNAWLLRFNTALANAFVAPMALASAALVVAAYRGLRDPKQRQRIRWVVFASGLALAPLLLWALLAVLRTAITPSPVSSGVWTVVDLLSNGATVLIPLAVAYAVVRHRVFDIAVVVRRSLQYLLARRALQVIFALPVLGLVITIIAHHDRTIGELLTQNAAYLWVMAAAGLSLRYRTFIGSWLDRRFFREQYDREQVLVTLISNLRRLDAPAQVAELVTRQLSRSLHPNAIRLWFDGDPDPPPEPLLGSVGLGGAELDTPLTAPELLPHGMRVAVPLLSTEERLEGMLMLGEKLSEEPYSDGDLSLLGMVAKQTAVVRENLLLRESIREERQVRADVLAHLEPDLLNLVKECPTCGACYDAALDRCSRDGHTLVHTLPVARVLAGRYRLDALIGRGGMGVVYEALDLRLQRVVAVKLLLDRVLGQERALRRFRREARAVARLQHPNIVAVYDYGAIEPHGAFLVMERIRGRTLREELHSRGPLTGAEAAEWFEPLLLGIEAAHEEGLIHRDLKPENVARVRPEYGSPTVKILDFGVAKLRPLDTTSDRLTATGAVIGTFGYMSPEQLGGHELDARSDLFAIGVMAVEAMTGRWPFHGSTHGELLAAIILEPYHFPGTTTGAGLLDAVLQRCLAKDPRDRYATAGDLRRELIPALRNFQGA